MDIDKVKTRRAFVTRGYILNLARVLVVGTEPLPSQNRIQEAIASIRPRTPSTPAPIFWKVPRHFKNGGNESFGRGHAKKYGKQDTKKYPGISRVMLAEDDADDAEFFSRSLSSLSASINLSIQTDGYELMRTLRDNEPLPDIVFLDVNMPRKNGYECLIEIRGDRRLKDLPVAIVSTSGDLRTVDELYDLGASAFIVKPRDFSSWAVLIDKVLGRKWSSPRVTREEFLIVA